MSNAKNYRFTLYRSIDGIRREDIELTENMAHPFKDIQGDFLGIDYSCKWNPKTCWYTDCRPAFFLRGTLDVGSLDEMMKKLPKIASGIAFDRVSLERFVKEAPNSEITEAKFEYANQELSYGDLGMGRNIPSNHPFYQKFSKMIDQMKGGVK